MTHYTAGLFLFMSRKMGNLFQGLVLVYNVNSFMLKVPPGFSNAYGDNCCQRVLHHIICYSCDQIIKLKTINEILLENCYYDTQKLFQSACVNTESFPIQKLRVVVGFNTLIWIIAWISRTFEPNWLNINSFTSKQNTRTTTHFICSGLLLQHTKQIHPFKCNQIIKPWSFAIKTQVAHMSLSEELF